MGSVLIKEGGDVVDVDGIDDALVTTDEIHANIHRGILFEATHVDLSVAASSSIEMLVQVDAGQSAHALINLETTGDATYELYEGTTFSAAGTAIDATNRNRESTNTAVTVVTHSPTVTDAGTRIDYHLRPGGGGPHAGGGSGMLYKEWVLRPGTAYLLRMTNINTSAHAVSMHVDWYEPVS